MIYKQKRVGLSQSIYNQNIIYTIMQQELIAEYVIFVACNFNHQNSTIFWKFLLVCILQLTDWQGISKLFFFFFSISVFLNLLSFLYLVILIMLISFRSLFGFDLKQQISDTYYFLSFPIYFFFIFFLFGQILVFLFCRQNNYVGSSGLWFKCKLN